MTEREMEEWQGRNNLLQNAYKEYLLASKQKDRDAALMRIQRELEWNPYMNLCVDHDADVFGISRYGLDSISEKCIDLIDKVAKGKIDYEF